MSDSGPPNLRSIRLGPRARPKPKAKPKAKLGTSESARRRCGVYIGDSPDKDKVKQVCVHVLCRPLN